MKSKHIPCIAWGCDIEHWPYQISPAGVVMKMAYGAKIFWWWSRNKKLRTNVISNKAKPPSFKIEEGLPFEVLEASMDQLVTRTSVSNKS